MTGNIRSYALKDLCGSEDVKLFLLNSDVHFVTVCVIQLILLRLCSTHRSMVFILLSLMDSGHGLTAFRSNVPVLMKMQLFTYCTSTVAEARPHCLQGWNSCDLCN